METARDSEPSPSSRIVPLVPFTDVHAHLRMTGRRCVGRMMQEMPAHLSVRPRRRRAWLREACSRGAIPVVCVGALLLADMRHPDAQSVPAVIERVLTTDFGFTSSEITSIGRGAAVARSLEMHDDREVSAVGAVRVAVPPPFYVERMMDIVSFKRHEVVLQIGVFGTSPSASDLARLTLDRADLNRLRDCGPGRCDINLSPEALARVRAGVDWGTVAGQARAAQQFRQVLADLVREYKARGDAALMTYRHGAREVSVAAEFQALITSPPTLLGRFPSLHHHITRYPNGATTSVQDVIYWSKEKVGPRTVTSVTHIAMVRLPAGASPAIYAGASRQLYGTELFEASLGLTLLLQDPGNANQIYLVYANRSRVDAIGGFLGVIKRGVVRSRARAAVPGTLDRARVNAERHYAELTAANGAR